jgi:hypothetical protein
MTRVDPTPLEVTKLRRTIVKKMLRNCLIGLGLALLVVSVAAAQDNFVKGGVAGVSGLHGEAVLPPAATFTNCGTGCTSYNTGSGYYISGTALSTGAGQTLAMGFKAKAATKFVKALSPNTVYTANGGVNKGAMSAFLLNGNATKGPTTELAKLVQTGTIPDYPTIRTIHYTLPKGAKPVTFKKGVTYFLCETEPVKNVQLLWMVSNSDVTSPFWFQVSDTCTKKGTVWNNTTGAVDGAAFEIN